MWATTYFEKKITPNTQTIFLATNTSGIIETQNWESSSLSIENVVAGL
jgi:hypothetical protein